MKKFLQILIPLVLFGVMIFESHYTLSAVFSRIELFSDNDLDALAKTINSDLIQRLDSAYDKLAIAGFSGSVLVARNGHVLFTRNTGFANYNTLQDINENSVFQLASASKQFTAMSVLLLSKEGKIDLDASVTHYIPELPYTNVTIRNLLNHTSGLPDYLGFLTRYWRDKGVNPTNEDVVGIMADKKIRLRFKPGSRFVYSNTGYVVLAAVVERISGLTFPQFAKKNIFEPLGMTHTFIHTTTVSVDSTTNNAMVSGHHGHNVISMTICDGPVGDKGVYSTVEDLYKWDQALEHYKLIPIQMQDAAFEAGHTNSGAEVPYGFGYRLRISPWGRLVYHNGLWGGFKSSFLRYVDTQTTVIALNNNNSRALHPLVEGLSKVVNEAQKDRVTEDIIFTLVKSNPETVSEKIQAILRTNASSQINEKKLRWAIDYLNITKKTQSAKNLVMLAYKLQGKDYNSDISIGMKN
ncbi:MAG: beta-lactamase family protein [Bacteroidetes bacterium]|nr:beta-lactamase family protein [Bacteroidota bacterium]